MSGVGRGLDGPPGKKKKMELVVIFGVVVFNTDKVPRDPCRVIGADSGHNE